MLYLCKVFSFVPAWLFCALVTLLPTVALAAPPPDGVAFLGVSILEQPDLRLSEQISRQLARMGEALLPRTRTKYCKDSLCFTELAQSAALRPARYLLSAEVYQSDARQQSITVRLFDTQHNKLEESVDACEQCDDDRRSELILVRYGQLRQQLASPPPPQLSAPSFPDPVDVCPNLDGVQTTVPDGMKTDFIGSCVPLPRDLCPNISGPQSTIPQGMVRDKLGNCTLPTPDDLCLNLEGIQAQVPDGLVRDSHGLCTAKQLNNNFAGHKQRLRIASALAGGIAVGMLAIGVTQAILARLGDEECKVDTSKVKMNGVCFKSYVIPAVELSVGGALGIVSMGLAIPLGRKN